MLKSNVEVVTKQFSKVKPAQTQEIEIEISKPIKNSVKTKNKVGDLNSEIKDCIKKSRSLPSTQTSRFLAVFSFE